MQLRQVFFIESIPILWPPYHLPAYRMDCQKHLFSLPDDIHYMNCATRGPLTIHVEHAGQEAILKTTRSIHQLTPDDFFEPAWEVRALFTHLIQAPDPERVALLPSVSYAMAIVARNLPFKPGFRAGQKIILLEGEFPSDVYAWERVAAEHHLTISTVPMPIGAEIGTAWNQTLLESIDSQTALVVCPHVHWMYGLIFDLERIALRAREVGAWLVVDGTQSVGALPFPFDTIKPDMLVCAGYKWLMGPYSLGLAYFGEAFDGGIPLEETWMGRVESTKFHRLTEYQSTYRPKAFRYNMGEQSNFIHLPMMKAALEQLLAWSPAAIQDYCRHLFQDAIGSIQEAGLLLDSSPRRAAHLFGIRIPPHTTVMDMQQRLAERKVFVSARGQGLRIAPHVYNTPADVGALLAALGIAS